MELAPKGSSDPEWITMKDRPSVLFTLAPLLGREVELDTLLERLLDQITQAVAGDRGTLYLIDPDAQELYSRAAHLPELKQIRLKLGQGIAGAVAATGEAVNLPRVEEDKRFFREIDRLTGYKTRSVVAAPLTDKKGRVIGVAQVLNARRGQFSGEDLAELKRLCGEAALAIENTSLYAQVRTRDRKPALPPRYRYNRVVGESPAMVAVFERVARSAATSATVLVRGESGTGKELIARAIHYNSPRKDGPFVKIDCTTLPPTLIENELFGHERGAYTGAETRTTGKCELAEGGTLFVDEIGELPPMLQPKLLRFLQDREFERVGGTRTKTADVRVVAATHRDLEAMVGRGEFREDLYYRLKVVQIALPPLRERGDDDILRLAEHFLDVYGKKHKKQLSFTGGTRARLVKHRWPGNIRELENCVESAVVLCEGGEVTEAELSLPWAAPPASRSKSGFRARPLADVERDHIVATLEAAGGNRSRAAALLGIGRNTLQRKLRQYRLDRGGAI
jgi:Nif-specific regulatory protein